MKYLILADIHGNLPALEAVLGDAPRFDQIWFLGDFVGYGPWPNECVERIWKIPHLAVLGNHDQAIFDERKLSWFNPYAQKAIILTQKILSSRVSNFLSVLPKKIELGGAVNLVHGSPRAPTDEYLTVAEEVFGIRNFISTQLTFVGHTHCPVVFILEKDQAWESSRRKFILDQNLRYVINPGGVGQPRDRDPQASYAIFDGATYEFEFRRTRYDILKTQRKMGELEFPSFLIERLSFGV